MWLKKFPEKRKRKYLDEVHAKCFWAAHLVWKLWKQRIARRKEQDAKYAEINHNTNLLANFKGQY